MKRENNGAQVHHQPARQKAPARSLIKKTGFFMAFLLGLFSFQLRAQDAAPDDPCKIADCYVHSLNISTGYDQVSGTYNTPLAQETNWEMIAVPTNAAITMPAPCWDINPHPAWASFANATWVSPFQNSIYTINNWPQNAYGAFEFQKCFCVCKDGSDINIDFELLCDDGAEIFLDGTPIATALLGYQFQWSKRLIFNQNFTLSAGTHCITIKLYNSGAVAMGFALQGTVTGSNLISPLCCNPNGRICGTKLWDSNCDKVVNPSTDMGLGGWTIELRDNLGNIISTTVTDAYGNYCFNNLPAGNYQVSEVMQPGWVQSFPTSPGIHHISLPAGGVATAYFGNCGTPHDPPCNFEMKYQFEINKCAFNGTPVIMGLPFGYQVIATEWTFGDGYSSNDYNGVHYYTNPGVYTVCLKVTIFNGKECCTQTYCKDIEIHERCDGGCTFDAEIGVSFNPSGCLYTFTANVFFAGQPITGYYWSFGDGTFGSGSPVDHQFPGPGVYKVCLYIFSTIYPDKCCYQQYCTEVVVECNPCGGDDGTTGHVKSKPVTNDKIELTDKNFVILNQNVPNPFAESTVITYNIQQKFSKAEIVFTNIDGRVIKTYNITQKGEGRLNVFADDLSSGIYLYSLIVDGATIESKRMVKH